MEHTTRKKLSALGSVAAMILILAVGCAANPKAIHVISREDGSGTRSAFVSLFGMEEDGVDRTRTDADITNSTAVMLTGIAGDANGIGYLSFSACNDMVKAVAIDGIAATADNIKNGTYSVSRPFTIVTGENCSEAARDFIDFICSAEGQSIVEAAGYIAAVEHAKPYSGAKPSGRVVAAGSSSVAPVMEALKEAYLQVNPNGSIQLQASDSTTGIHCVKAGICDIGMASRALNDEEASAGLNATAIAIDGIAVIVHRENPVENLTKAQVKAIFTGGITDWSALC